MDAALHRIETESPSTIRVVLVDEHEQELWGLWKLVEGEWPRMVVAGTAKTLDMAAKLSGGQLADVIVTDILPALRSGLSRFSELSREAGTAIVVLTDVCNRDLDRRLMEAGASAVVQKQEPAEVLLDQIERSGRSTPEAARNHELPEEPAAVLRAKPT